jgi:hypothetical protein
MKIVSFKIQMNAGIAQAQRFHHFKICNFFFYKIREQEGGTGPAWGRGFGISGRGRW